ncbi:hypothetical protein L0664_03900 [Octadecabacter sp. G9-8]|uniref:Glycine zipper domain-containing protein n=1 Tax=Octadecabacter dasysiphoniae TaxID=2909341 RepID=A0ABS9CSI9_9RHOB|nr:hypothetical protein [Octadecabacter dasysiphoniae]MCF2870200.1 hypothetical protein [Octadecabacter dasysiphoniae]
MIATVLLSACSTGGVPPIETSRVDSGALYFYNDPVNEGPVIDQVAALNDASKQLVQTSTVNGAMIGAALGCGLTVLSASNARNCLTGAVVGGAGGAVIGNRVGQRNVERRVELVSPNAVVRDLELATNQFDNIQTDLPQFIARQEAELNTLTMQLVRGEIDQSEHDISVLRIAGERADLAEALTLSARDARQASRNLKAAASRGQTGLDWHIGAAARLAEDVESTRSTFSML